VTMGQSSPRFHSVRSAGAGLLWALSPAVQAGTCPRTIAVAEIGARLDRAERAYGDLDIETFRVETEGVLTDLGCVHGEIDRPLAARIHRVRAISAFGERDMKDAESSFLSALRADPDLSLADVLVPEGHPLWTLLAGGDPTALELVEIANPVYGSIRFDGIAGVGGKAAPRPEGIPTLFQQVPSDPEGPWTTALLEATDPLPAYAARKDGAGRGEDAEAEARDLAWGELDEEETSTIAGDEARPERREKKSIRIPLLAAGGAAAVTTGVLYGLGAQSRAAYFEAESTEDLEALRAKTNALAVGSTVTGVVALGAGVGFVLVGAW
jgi:hypothetical protein